MVQTEPPQDGLIEYVVAVGGADEHHVSVALVELLHDRDGHAVELAIDVASIAPSRRDGVDLIQHENAGHGARVVEHLGNVSLRAT